MTKTKKIAAVTVSVVLAGTMAMGLTACGKKSTNKYGDGVVNMNYASQTELNVAIGYNSLTTGLFYNGGINTKSGTATYVGGYQASNGAAKPAAKAIMDALDIKLVDKYSGNSTSKNLTELVNDNSWTNGDVDMATSDLSVAVAQANKSEKTVLNLAEYLQYMPNFQKFLNDNPVVYLSLLQDGMNANGDGQKLYVAPYFDGMDDIEKGCLMRQDWIVAVLDDDNPWTNYVANNDTFWTACYSNAFTDSDGEATNGDENHSSYTARSGADGTHATSYMGSTDWSIVSTAEGDADGSETVTITKSYSAALRELNNNNSALAGAFDAIATDGTVTASSYASTSGASGNIVDIMNAAITGDTTKEGATGEHLAELYREYIKVAYLVDNSGYYGTETNPVSNVFNGYSACWDVDDLVALLRIIKCSSGQVGLSKETCYDGTAEKQYEYKTVGIFPRDGTNDRTPDLISLVGELYGCRGATSRYEYTYIDGQGELQDARADVKFWNSLEAFGGLCEEGLVDSTYITNGVGTNSVNADQLKGTSTIYGTGFMQWDYSQTQTTAEFGKMAADGDASQDESYTGSVLYGWVNTPVSTWEDSTSKSAGGFDEDGYSYRTVSKSTYSGSTWTNSTVSEKYMRFTDSWRSTKTSGLVVNGSVANDPDKLAAALAFVDFLYSNDGQITTTYAIQDTTDNSGTPNGTWYGTPVEISELDTDAESLDEVCDVVGQYVIKDEYVDEYTVYNGMICDLKGNPATATIDGVEEDVSAELDVYADYRTDFGYYVKEEYQASAFAFGGTLYSGELYKGKQTPIVTDELKINFNDPSSAECSYNSSNWAYRSFTNFARGILGSTLPICVKDQSFENQLTAERAKECSTKVSVSIANGTINHCELAVTDNMFYTCVPTGLPTPSQYQDLLDNANMNNLLYLTGTSNDGTKTFWPVYHHVIWFGYTGTYNLNACLLNFDSSGINSAKEMIEYLYTQNLGRRIDAIGQGWTVAKTYIDYLSL